MANPVIDSVVATPSTVAPGGTSDVQITAHDPDSQVVPVTVTVTDGQGNQNQSMINISISDPLTYLVTVPAGQGSVMQDGVDPSLWHYTAP